MNTHSAQLRASIIIPAYNAAHCLKKAVDSALAQTEPSLEVLIVDDCSQDGTWEVAVACARQDHRIRPFRLAQNGGKSCAMNYATALALGKWIAVLDADDWYAPGRIKHLLDSAEAAQVDMVADNQFFVDMKAQKHAGTAFKKNGEPIMLGLDSFLAGSDSTASFDYGMLKPVFRAAFIREHKIGYYLPAQRGEDFYVLLDYFFAGGRALVVREPYYYYMQPFGQISGQWSQHDRVQYEFCLMKRVNDDYIARFKGKVSSANLCRLKLRGQGFEAMAAFHYLRACMKKKNMAGVLETMIHAPLRLWPMLAKRLLKRVLCRR